MSIGARFTGLLLRLYPRAWRNEYGAELEDLLARNPLGLATVVNVAAHGVYQRVRTADPATGVGLVMMTAVSAMLVANITAPLPYGSIWTTVLQPSGITFPAVLIAPLDSDVYALVVTALACVIQLRNGPTPARTVVAGLKVGALSALPIVAIAALMALGALQVVALGPGQAVAPANVATLTYYSADGTVPSALEVLSSPVSRLGMSAVWASLGGYIGQWLARRSTPARV